MSQVSHPVVQATGSFSPQITLDVTPQMMAVLQQIAREAGQPLDVVFTRAIALYRAALQANLKGKHVGYAESPDALEAEFTGIVGPEEREG